VTLVEILLLLILIVLVAAFFPGLAHNILTSVHEIISAVISFGAPTIVALMALGLISLIFGAILLGSLGIGTWFAGALRQWLLVAIGPVIRPYRSWKQIQRRRHAGESIHPRTALYELSASFLFALLAWSILVLPFVILIAMWESNPFILR
jgi:hypothetical protein